MVPAPRLTSIAPTEIQRWAEARGIGRIPNAHIEIRRAGPFVGFTEIVVVIDSAAWTGRS
jgi:hypothetical protein